MFKFIRKSSYNKSNNRKKVKQNIPVSKALKDNRGYIENTFTKCTDVIIREFKITNNPKYSAMLVYIKNMLAQETIDESIIKKLTGSSRAYAYNPGSMEYSQNLLGISYNYILKNIVEAVDSILYGNAVLFIDGISNALVINYKNPPERNIEEPATETVVRGPREGFTESISLNACLLRKRIKDTNLKIESFIIGRRTKTEIALTYVLGIVNNKIVMEVKKRLNKIDTDSILSANHLEEYIEDSPLSIFPTIFRTEKPDVLVSKLLEGRVGIIIDGNPEVLIIPSIFIEFLQSPEDYSTRYIAATLNRWLRYISFFLTLIMPGFYVALVGTERELIPSALMATIIKARTGVPFPVLWECFIMLFVYEVLREAGVRMPRAVGQAISVVGALVLGEAAVEAGLVSTPMVIVIALTGITSFTIPYPEMNSAVMFPRVVLLFLGGGFGMLGLMSGLLLLFFNLISVRSFGVPYLSPLAPLSTNQLSDIAIRSPLWAMFKRPYIYTWQHSLRKKPKSQIKTIRKEHKESENKKVKRSKRL